MLEKRKKSDKLIDLHRATCGFGNQSYASTKHSIDLQRDTYFRWDVLNERNDKFHCIEGGPEKRYQDIDFFQT